MVKAIRQLIDQMVADKTYFLPIGHVTRKKKAQNGMIGVLMLLILIVAGGFFAYQTGLLKSVF